MRAIVGGCSAAAEPKDLDLSADHKAAAKLALMDTDKRIVEHFRDDTGKYVEAARRLGVDVAEATENELVQRSSGKTKKPQKKRRGGGGRKKKKRASG